MVIGIAIGSLALLLVMILILKSKKKEEIKEEIIEIPEGVITPLEALMLDQKQKDHLKVVMKRVNDTLTKTIDGHTKTCIIDFEFNDSFPKESVYEIQRLYKKAGWEVDLVEYWNARWKLNFTLPNNVELPKQLTNIRIDLRKPQEESELSLEELGIDTLEQKFKELEKTKSK